jgi:hypothetical protein
MKTNVNLLRALDSLENASKLLDALADSIYDKHKQDQACDILDLVNAARVFVDKVVRDGQGQANDE